MSEVSAPSRPTLAITALLSETFSGLGRNLLVILKMGWPLVFFNIILTVSAYPMLEALGADLQDPKSTHMTIKWPEMDTAQQVILVLASIGFLLAGQSLSVNVARLTSLGSKAGNTPFAEALTFGKRQLLALALYLITLCLVMPFYLSRIGGASAVLVVGLATIVVFLVVGPALLLTLPAIALDVPNPAKKAWMVASGYRWQIVIAWVITTGVLLIIFTAVELALMLFEMGGWMLLPDQAAVGDSLSVEPSAALTMLLGALSGVLTVIWQAGPTILAASIWTRLSRVTADA